MKDFDGKASHKELGREREHRIGPVITMGEDV